MSKILFKNKLHIIYSVLLIVGIIIDVNSANDDILLKLKVERDIISSAIESINMINKSKLVAINSTTSDSMLLYADLLKMLDSPDLLKLNSNKQNELMTSCINAHRIFIKDSKIRIKDNLDLITELKEVYPDIFKESFCIDSFSRYTETLSAIDNMKSDSADIYEIIKMIIMSDRIFSVDINDFKAVK
jgi:hypothetical protein